MKKPKIIRLRLLFGLVPGKSRRRGVAIITVLAIISLMTVLIISFFNMAQSQKTTAIGSAEMQRVITLKDTAINLVMAQIREATTLPGSGNTQTIFTTGPGNVRTFDGSNSELTRFYKLYSAEKMLVKGITPGKTGNSALLADLKKDIDPKWDQYPDMWFDLNKPVRPATVGNEEDNPNKVKNRLIYPIVNPRRYNGRATDVTENTEGFSYGEQSLDSVTVNGVDSKKGQLAMPVRWIYFLEDGTPGVVARDGKFTAIGKSEGKPSDANPIVSRLAWWTDDESCKINVNTASLPIPWDTPRTNSVEDVWYAQHQPANGEVHHYPSHPSQTDMCAVLFPGYRYSPDLTAMPIGNPDMKALPQKYASLIWNIAPFITENGGTEGGTKMTRLAQDPPVTLDDDDHLFATFEELYFKAKKEDKNLNRARETVSRDDNGSRMLDRLGESQFFLTTRSNGPEMTIYNTPRLCMFPTHFSVVAEVGKKGGTIPPNVGAFEVTMATNCTIAGQPYYFLRADNPGSRHVNFFNDHGGRNALLMRYLKNLTEAIPPGHPELKSINTFKAKYPSPNPKGEANSSNQDFDGTDKSEILLSMLDFIRSTNMTPGYLPGGNAYDDGNGQVSGICGCSNIGQDPNGYHTTALAYNGKLVTPKGSGRTYGAAEVILVGHVAAIKKGTNIQGIPPGQPGMLAQPPTVTKWGETKAASLVQIGVLLNAFSPRQGWAPLFANAGLNVSSTLAASGTDARSPGNATDFSPIIAANGSTEYKVLIGLGGGNGTAANGFNAAAVLPPVGVVPWAGMTGARLLASTQVAYLDPIVFEGNGAGETGPITVNLKWNPGQSLRIFMYDEGTPSSYNVTQAIDLDLGNNSIEMVMDYTGKTLATLMKEAKTFPPAKVAATSFVLPSGDYRLSTIPLRVERGQMVPHGTGAHAVKEPTLAGRNVTMQGSGQVAKGNQGLLVDTTSTPPLNAINELNAPHLAPVVAKYLCNPDLGNAPMNSVLTTASSHGDEIRLKRFANGRRDAQNNYSGTPNNIPNRGSSDPLETGDFDNGVGLCPDGPYMNQPDDGDCRDSIYPYYQTLTVKNKATPASFSPNRLVRSPVEFGSIPNGLQARVPWQTLRFRPDPQMYDPQHQINQASDMPKKVDGYNHYFPFSNYCGPKDHLLLDLFWMPCVEPWAISEAFATKGLINLNQQIFPFTYITRTTALNALLRSERMMAIPDANSNDYKDGTKLPDKNVYRHWINAKETLKQLVDFRWRGFDAEDQELPFNVFRAASEVCELWLVPEKNGQGVEDGTWDLRFIIQEFWKHHRLTGDNMRERPYANIYPRLTTRSNVFKVHIVAQTLKKAASNPDDTFSTEYKDGADPDSVTAEWRGSALIERVINPNDKELKASNIDYAKFKAGNQNAAETPNLNNFYNYRVTEVKQLTE